MTDLNREIAEKVMQWHTIMEPQWPYLNKDGNYIGFSKYGKNAWRPSADPTQAFMVVERMRELGWEFQLNIGDGYEASFWKEWTELLPTGLEATITSKNFEGVSDIPAEAICQAALKAMELKR